MALLTQHSCIASMDETVWDQRNLKNTFTLWNSWYSHLYSFAVKTDAIGI